MEIMADFLDYHNIDVPYFVKKNEPEKPVESPEHYHNAQSQGNNKYALTSRVKQFSQISDRDSFSDI